MQISRSVLEIIHLDQREDKGFNYTLSNLHPKLNFKE